MTIQWLIPLLCALVLANSQTYYVLPVMSGINLPHGMWANSLGDIFVVERGLSRIVLYTHSGARSVIAGGGALGDGYAATSVALSDPTGVWGTTNGDLYISEYGGKRVRYIAANGIASTFAGTGIAGFSGDGLSPTSAQLQGPVFTWVDSAGNVFLADRDNARLRKVSAATRLLTTVAGTATRAVVLTSGPALSTSFKIVEGVHGDTAGNVFVSDWDAQVVKKLDTSGILSVVAGSGVMANNGDGVPATSADMVHPYSLFADRHGNLFIGSIDAPFIRKVNTANIVHTIAGTGVKGNTGDYGPGTSAQIGHVYGLFGLPNGDLLFTDRLAGLVRKLSTLTPTSQPTSQPSAQPTRQPSSQPSCQPSSQPSAQPTRQPSRQPSGQPTRQPTTQPSRQPSGQPTANPTQPTTQPSSQPSRQPSAQPSSQPTCQPLSHPSAQPTQSPSSQPSGQPTAYPTQPSARPTGQPSSQPSVFPSAQPSVHPTRSPSSQPTAQPSNKPTMQPSPQPSSQPTALPSREPSSRPTAQPSRVPSGQPSVSPSGQPTVVPSTEPSTCPSVWPSAQPSSDPSAQPSSIPSRQPSIQPSAKPSAQPLSQPSSQPSVQPSAEPSADPSSQPSDEPTGMPSSAPSTEPSALPSAQPSRQPSTQPSSVPTALPSCEPSANPSTEPTVLPTGQPTSLPSSQPSGVPSSSPTARPSVQPSGRPSTQPSAIPSTSPSTQPSGLPSTQPSIQPTVFPSAQPSSKPSSQPSVQPTAQPSAQPSAQPTLEPTSDPTAQPSSTPSAQPSNVPSCQPSSQPSSEPSVRPSAQPSIAPSRSPSSAPSAQPSVAPSEQPSAQPSSVPSLYVEECRFDVRVPLLSAMCGSAVLDISDSLSACGVRVLTNDQLLVTLYSLKNRESENARQMGWVHEPVRVPLSHMTQKDVWSSLLLRYLSLEENVDYVISVRWCVGDKWCAQGLSRMEKAVNVSLSLPIVKIAGPSQRNMTTAMSLSLSAHAHVVDCSAESRTGQLQFEWSCSDARFELPSNCSSISLEPSRFMLPPYTLRGESEYHMKVRVRDTLSALSENKAHRLWSEAEVVVRVEASSPVAILRPAASVLSLRAGASLTLDASSSFDPDALISGVHLNGTIPGISSFVWNCRRSFSHFMNATTETANEREGNNKCPFVMRIATDSPWLVNLFANVSARNTSAWIELRVMNDAGLSASVSTHVHVMPDETAPLISMSTPAQSLHRVNVDKTLLLTAAVTNQEEEAMQCAWRETQSGLDLGPVAQTALSQRIAGGVVEKVVYLSLSAHAMRDRSIYSFTLHCGTSSVSVAVSTNGRPTNGSLSVYPLSGVELSTYFSLTAMHWTDEDLPLSYRFSLLTAETADLNGSSLFSSSVVLKERTEDETITTQLAASGEGSALVQLAVFDALSASSAVQRAVSLETQSAQNVLAMIELSLGSEPALSRMSSEALQQTIAVLSAALSRVNCSADMREKCAQLHRDGCGNVEGTCGPCSPGFVGENGARNSMCVDANSTDAISPLLSLSKSCVGECSGHGECLFFSSITEERVSSCSVGSGYCHAYCVCTEGFAGSSCAHTTESHAARLNATLSLLRALQLLTNSSSSAFIESNAQYLSVITRVVDMHTFFRETADMAHSVLEKLLFMAQQDESVSFAAVQSLQEVLDLQLSSATTLRKNIAASNERTGRESSVVNASSTVTVAQAMSQVLRWTQVSSREKVTGERATILRASLMFVELARYAYEAGAVSFANVSERKSYERNTVASFVGALGANNRSTTIDAVTVDMMTFDRSLWPPNNIIDSNNTKLSNNSGPSSQRIVSPIVTMRSDGTEETLLSLQLPSLYNISLDTSFASSNVTVLCSAGYVGWANATCTSSGVRVGQWCAGWKRDYVVTLTCPVLRLRCVLLDMHSYAVIESTQCETVQENGEQAVCRCRSRISNVDNRRSLSSSTSATDTAAADGSLSALDEIGVITLALMAKNVFEDSQSTFEVAQDFNASDLQKVHYVISAFGSVWLFGALLMALARWRYQSALKSSTHKQVAMEIAVLGGGTKLAASQLQRRRRGSVVKPESVPFPASTASTGDARAKGLQKLQQYVNSVIPPAFSQNSILGHMLQELRERHAYFRFFTGSWSRDSFPLVGVLDLVTTQSLLMFLLALLYDLQAPKDDGSCVTLENEPLCEHRKSLFNPRQSYCEWDALTNSCAYRTPHFSFEVALYCAVLVSLLTGVATLPLELVFRILYAPTEDFLRAKVAAASLSSMASRAGPSSGGRKAAVSMQAKSELLRKVEEEFRSSTEQQSKLTAKLVVKHIPGQTHAAHDEAKRFLTAALELSSHNCMQNSAASFSNTHPLGLLGALKAQRALLNSTEERRVFDEGWGLSELFETPPDAKGETESDELNLKLRLISEEVKRVESMSNENIIRIAGTSEEQMGVELLQLFVLDLLGRDTLSATILRTKIEEDFESLTAVSKSVKLLALIFVVSLNLFFGYYVMLRGFERGLSWQRAYVLGVTFQLLVDALLFETMECLYVNYLLPSFARGEVQQVQVALQEVIMHLSRSIQYEDDRNSLVLNAPEYLFVSSTVARAFPQLIESTVVQAYRTYLPGATAHKWRTINIDGQPSSATVHTNFSHNNGTVATRPTRRRATAAVSAMLSWIMLSVIARVLAHTPLGLQRLALRVLQPFILGGLMYIWRFVLADHKVLIVVAVVMLIAVLLLWVQHHRWKQRRAHRSASVLPLSIEQKHFYPDRNNIHSARRKSVCEGKQQEIFQDALLSQPVRQGEGSLDCVSHEDSISFEEFCLSEESMMLSVDDDSDEEMIPSSLPHELELWSFSEEKSCRAST